MGTLGVLLVIAVIHGVHQIRNDTTGKHLTFVGVSAKDQICLGGVFVDVCGIMIQHDHRQGWIFPGEKFCKCLPFLLTIATDG